MNCLKCDTDLDSFMDFDNLTKDFIECPECGNKMTIEYDEYEGHNCDGVEEWYDMWWVKQYEEVK